VLGLERTEQRLLGTENLDGGTGRLSEVHKRTGVGDEAGTDKLTNESSQVRCKSLHTRGEVCAEVLAMLGEVDDLLGESAGGLQILLGDLGTHTDLSSGLDGGLNLLRQNARQISVLGVCAETHLEDNLGVGEVVVQDPGKLREVPAIPFLDAHSVCVQLLVKDVETGNGLDNHSIDLVRRKLELVTGEGVRKTQAGRVHLGGDQVRDERGHMLSDSTVDILGRGVGDGLDREARELRDGVGELGVGDSHCRLLVFRNFCHKWIAMRTRCLGLVLEFLQQVAEHGADLAVGEGSGFIQRGDGTVELGELLQLQRLDNSRDILAELISLAEQLLVLGLEQSITRAAIVCQYLVLCGLVRARGSRTSSR